jgi:hypothetical protein
MRVRRRFLQLSFVALVVSAARAAWLRADPQPPTLEPPRLSGPTPTAQPRLPGPTPTAQPPSAQPPQHVWVPWASAHLPAAEVALPRADLQSAEQTWVPIARSSSPAGDAPLIGPVTGSADQAIAWLAARASGYTLDDITSIVATYQSFGAAVGLDWFLALAQLAHETGSLSSWWSQPPRRNPAGIGVTGAARDGLPDGMPGPAPGPAWAWNDLSKQWLEGVSFATWASDAVPAHLGRLLAYALRDDQANSTQQELIGWALLYRSLPASHRGVAPTIIGLNGRWAVPGTSYGQRIMALAQQMRAG